MINKLLLFSSVQAYHLWWKKDEEESKIKYDPAHEDKAYIYDRSHGDEDIRMRKKNALEWLEMWMPWLYPHHDS